LARFYWRLSQFCGLKTDGIVLIFNFFSSNHTGLVDLYFGSGNEFAESLEEIEGARKKNRAFAGATHLRTGILTGWTRGQDEG
jgi:hypothetical protein